LKSSTAKGFRQPADDLDATVDATIESSDLRGCLSDGLLCSLKPLSEQRVHQDKQGLLPVSRDEAQDQNSDNSGPSPRWAYVSSKDAGLYRRTGYADGDTERDNPVELDVAEYRVAGPGLAHDRYRLRPREHHRSEP
jgi:hypothetical protein